jgi:polar amino acid transport system permease protein
VAHPRLRAVTRATLAAASPSLISPLKLGALLLLAAPAVLGRAEAGPAAISIAGALVQWAPLIFRGFLLNLLVSVLAMAIGTVLGIGLGLLASSLLAPVRGAAWLVTQFFRNAPWLALLFYCMFLLPFELHLFGLTLPLPDWSKATIGLALPVMANVAEIVRGAVQSIEYGQWEAAKALSLTRMQTWRLVILPQCVKRMLPPWMSLYAVLTMATPLISIVGVQDAMAMVRAALTSDGRPELLIPMYVMLLAWFFLYCYPIARWTQALERRYAVLT